MSQANFTARELTGDDKELSEAIRRAVFEIIGRHERAEHNGEPCGLNRVGFIAWLAHSLGVSSAHLEKLTSVIAMYEVDCPCGVPTLELRHFESHREG